MCVFDSFLTEKKSYLKVDLKIQSQLGLRTLGEVIRSVVKEGASLVTKCPYLEYLE